MEFSFDFKMTEENKKAIEEILKQKGAKHYVLETKDKDKLDLVEYKDYKELEKEKEELIESLNEKIKKCEELIIKHKQSIKGIVNISDNNRHLILIKTLGIEKQTYQEILSKIEKR